MELEAKLKVDAGELRQLWDIFAKVMAALQNGQPPARPESARESALQPPKPAG